MTSKRKTFVDKETLPAMYDKHGDIIPARLVMILEDFKEHIKKEFGTIDNYPREAELRRWEKEFPDIIDLDEVEAVSQNKINIIMDYVITMLKRNERINNPTELYKMAITYLRRSKVVDFAPTIVIRDTPSWVGQSTNPQRKKTFVDKETKDPNEVLQKKLSSL